MNFKEKIVSWLENKGVTILKVEQEGDNKSVVCHVPVSQNNFVSQFKDEMEKELDVAVVQSDMFGMNTVIVESNNL